MNSLIGILQDNAVLTLICGFLTSLIIQVIKKLPWFTEISISDVWKGRIASLLVSVLTSVIALVAAGDYSGIIAAAIAGAQTWLVAQGSWAGLLRGEKAI